MVSPKPLCQTCAILETCWLRVREVMWCAPTTAIPITHARGSIATILRIIYVQTYIHGELIKSFFTLVESKVPRAVESAPIEKRACPRHSIPWQLPIERCAPLASSPFGTPRCCEPLMTIIILMGHPYGSVWYRMLHRTCSHQLTVGSTYVSRCMYVCIDRHFPALALPLCTGAYDDRRLITSTRRVYRILLGHVCSNRILLAA